MKFSFFKLLMCSNIVFSCSQKLGAQNGRSNGVHLMEIHTASPKGSPFLITVLYVIIALGAVTGVYFIIHFLPKHAC